MLECTARRAFRPGRRSAAALLSPCATLVPLPASAAGLDGDPGAWLFATVAFVGIGLASYLAGRGRRAPAPPAPPPAAEPARPAARPAPMPLEAWAAQRETDPRPLLLLQADSQGAQRLTLANAAARRALRIGPEAVGQPWAATEAQAPQALRSALADPAAPGPWWVLNDEPSRSWLALGPEASAADGETASLVYTVSHDLRAPIRVVDGFARIVKEDYGHRLDRVGNDHLDRVLAAAARMNQMIDALLTMARLASQPLVRQPVDLSQLAAFVVEDLHRSAPDREVACEIEPGLRALGDPTLLRQVLENLLGNAWKYTARQERAQVAFGRETRDGRSVYVVRDNGAGFDMRVADRLFGLFQRLHSAKDFPGTGVGLASVRRIVQRHGGEIWAESTPNQGARFYFTLAD